MWRQAESRYSGPKTDGMMHAKSGGGELFLRARMANNPKTRAGSTVEPLYW
jgi:hypothetical protein